MGIHSMSGCSHGAMPQSQGGEHSTFYFIGGASGHNGRRTNKMEDRVVVVLEKKAQACF